MNWKADKSLSVYKYNQDVRRVGYETLDPVLFLLQSHDVEVQRASSAALGSLAVNGKLFIRTLHN